MTITINVNVDGSQAVELLALLIDMESEGFADRAAAKQLAATLRQHTESVKAAMAAATAPPAP